MGVFHVFKIVPMVPNHATHHIYFLMTLSHVKLVHAVTFMKYLAGVVSLIFQPKTLICNKITFLASSSLNVAESAVSELIKSISKKFTNYPFAIRLITAY